MKVHPKDTQHLHEVIGFGLCHNPMPRRVQAPSCQSLLPARFHPCCGQQYTSYVAALLHWDQAHSWPYVGSHGRLRSPPNPCRSIDDLERVDLPLAARAMYFLSLMATFPATPALFRPTLPFGEPATSYACVLAMAYDFLETVRSRSEEYHMFLAILLKADDVDFGIDPRRHVPYFSFWADYAYPLLPKPTREQAASPCRVIVHDWLL